MFTKAAALLKGCKSFLIIFDTDGDGIGSAAIFSKAIERTFGVLPKAMHKENGLSFISDETLERVLGKYDAVIILDITASERPEHVKEMARYSKVLIVDHHQTKNDMNCENIVQINPDIIKSKTASHRYCTSKLSYDICANFCDVDDLSWLAAIGIANDMAMKSWQAFLRKVYRKHGINSEKLIEANNIITSSYQFSKKPGNLIGYKACMEASGPEDILKARTSNAKKLWRFYSIIEGEIRKNVESWRKNACVFEDKKLLILEIKTRFSISSAVSTLLSLSMPHHTIIVARKMGRTVSVSFRRQDKKVNCSQLAKKVASMFHNASGGGHVPAAGMKLMTKDWEKAKKKIQEIL